MIFTLLNKHNGTFVQVDSSNISSIQQVRGEIEYTTSDGNVLINPPFMVLLESLENDFKRIDVATLVNKMDFIELDESNNLVKTRNGQKLPVSQVKLAEVKKMVENLMKE